MFISDIGLQFSFLVLSLPGFDIRVILEVFLPSSAIFERVLE